MKSKWLLVSVCAFLLAFSAASSDEPADAPAANGKEKAAERYIQTLSDYLTVMDVSESLVAANGLGIDVAVPEAALRSQLGLAEGKGLVVTAVPDDTIGKKAGLQVHDIVLQVYGHDVGDLKTLGEMLDAVDGQPVKVKILRGGKTIELDATPKKPEVAKVRFREALDQALSVELVSEESYRIGVTLSEADDTLRAHLRLAAGEGLVVTEVVADSAAAGVGIQQHDVFVVLDSKRLTTVEAINTQIQQIKDKAVELRLVRGGKEVALEITPRKTQAAAFVDRPITYWDTKSCQRCHANPWGDRAHVHAALRQNADRSVWTDGNTVKLWGHLLLDNPDQPATATAPQQQIDALKTQLEQMRKTLTALESSLAPAAPEAEKKD